MFINVSDLNGVVAIGDYSISWGNADPINDLPGFFSINLGQMSIEFGDIDQGIPGIYITRYADGDVESTTPILQLK